MEQALTLRIMLENPPAGVDYGLQEGSGRDYVTVQKQRASGGSLRFEAQVCVKGRPDQAPDFGGPLVQGPPGQRFLYIDIGTYAGQADSIWERRLKIPLQGITREMLQPALSGESAVLETRVAGTAKDGGPNCGTAKPFDGWTARRF